VPPVPAEAVGSVKTDGEEIRVRASLVASTLPGMSSAHPADEAQVLRDEIAQTREHLGDAVGQLAARAGWRSGPGLRPPG
jgi:hypothetical protein